MKLKKDNTKNIIIAAFLGLGFLGLGVLPIVGSEMTFADSTGEEITVQVTVPEYIAITNAESIPSEMEISNSTGLSATQAIVVKTNIPNGYVLTAKAISDDSSGVVSNKMLRRNGSGVAVSDTGINSLTTKSTYANMPDGTWGLAVDATNFRPIATTASGSGIIAYSTAPVAAATTNVTFAAKSNNSLVAGTYSATIRFTALGNDDGNAKTLYGD